MELTTQAIVLREVNYKESDKILTLLTKDNGKLTVTARSCRKKGGGISAAAQLLTWSDVTLKEHRGRWILSEAVTNMEFRSLRTSLEQLAVASYFAELTETVTQQDIPVPEIMALLLNSLYALDTLKKPVPIVKAGFELRLLCLTGYAPYLECCAVCGRQPEEPRLHLQEGILCCRGCRTATGTAMTLEQGTLSAMRHICTCASKRLFSFRLSPQSEKQLGDVCEAFLLTQLERGFHTLDFYKQVKGI
jgi:DNA repair protein RecO (recombination protein O)